MTVVDWVDKKFLPPPTLVFPFYDHDHGIFSVVSVDQRFQHPLTIAVYVDFHTGILLHSRFRHHHVGPCEHKGYLAFQETVSLPLESFFPYLFALVGCLSFFSSSFSFCSCEM